jgi:translation elongation factor aEF-1 beta
MGQVLLKYRIAPEDSSSDIAAVEKAVRAAIPATLGKVNKAEVQPFVFGMKVLVASFIVEDVEGNNDKLEQILLAVPGVGGADLLDMGRLM